jgi:hypothetical protein
VPSLVHDAADAETGGHTQEYDVFISHASEDKASVVRPLAHALRSLGLGVWYDEFELRIGDSLRRKIDRGLANSRFGIVVLSQWFFAKGWPNYELDGLVTRAGSGEQILLPIWHNVSKDEVIKCSPSLVFPYRSTLLPDQVPAAVHLLESPPRSDGSRTHASAESPGNS